MYSEDFNRECRLAGLDPASVARFMDQGRQSQEMKLVTLQELYPMPRLKHKYKKRQYIEGDPIRKRRK